MIRLNGHQSEISLALSAVHSVLHPTQSGEVRGADGELTDEAAERVYWESVSSHPVTQSRGTAKHKENDDSVRH